jgi:chemotaxis protein CheD
VNRERYPRPIQNDHEEIYLQPGELFVAHRPTIIRTILGSCVGASFWSPGSGVGALFHAQLPTCPVDQLSSPDRSDLHRYVDSSIRDIARQFDTLGLNRSSVEVKTFGGGDVLRGFDGAVGRPTVGRLNRQSAERVIESEGFAVSASCMGGNVGLKIAFNTATGEVLVRRLA